MSDTVVFIPDRDELSLLRFDGKDGPVYFVIKGLATKAGGDAAMQSSAAYRYEEHSCPTNWLRDCVAVIEDGDEDPHGFLDHVRTVQVPKDFEPQSWRDLFPEAFGGATIDGTAEAQSDQAALTAETAKDLK